MLRLEPYYIIVNEGHLKEIGQQYIIISDSGMPTAAKTIHEASRFELWEIAYAALINLKNYSGLVIRKVTLTIE